jgi:MoaA/NifB/PqqE/SkfB family radical SAM enzyme
MNVIENISVLINNNILKIRTKPRALQLPITNRCNSRCVTCRIWQENKTPIDIDATALHNALKDKFFSKVNSVGVNGGEPSLYPDIVKLLDSLFVLRNLKRIFLITNGMVTTKILEFLETMKKKCSEHNVKLIVTVSLDGVGNIDNHIRGIPAAFEKTIATIQEILINKVKYCDYFDIGCTLSKDNMDYVEELETYLDKMGLKAWFHPAVSNKRLHNFEDNSFSLLNDEHSRMLATEYFFTQYKYGHSFKTRLRAFFTYDYFLHKGKRRLASCQYLRGDVTITENLDLCLCARASNIIGNLRNESASSMLKSGKFKKREKEVSQYCNECIHYVVYPTVSGMIQFIKELLKPGIWLVYKVLA